MHLVSRCAPHLEFQHPTPHDVLIINVRQTIGLTIQGDRLDVDILGTVVHSPHGEATGRQLDHHLIEEWRAEIIASASRLRLDCS